jgi:hypothetical protein
VPRGDDAGGGVRLEGPVWRELVEGLSAVDARYANHGGQVLQRRASMLVAAGEVFVNTPGGVRRWTVGGKSLPRLVMSRAEQQADADVVRLGARLAMFEHTRMRWLGGSSGPSGEGGVGLLRLRRLHGPANWSQLAAQQPGWGVSLWRGPGVDTGHAAVELPPIWRGDWLAAGRATPGGGWATVVQDGQFLDWVELVEGSGGAWEVGSRVRLGTLVQGGGAGWVQVHVRGHTGLAVLPTGTVVAVDRSSGRLRWMYEHPQTRPWVAGRTDLLIGSSSASSGLAGGVLVLCVPGQGQVLGLDVEAGRQVWQVRAWGRERVVDAGGQRVLTVGRRGIRAFEPGGLGWWSRLLGPVESAARVGGSVVAWAGDGLWLMDGEGGRLIRRHAAVRPLPGSTVVTDGDVVVLASPDDVAVYAVRRGEWEAKP